MMEAITLHLSKNQDYELYPEHRLNNYRGTTKTIHAIGAGT